MADQTPLDQKQDLAASEVFATRAAPFQLWIGGIQPVTDAAKSAAAILKYQVCALLANNTVTPFVSGTHQPNQIVIAAQPASGAGVDVPYWSAGRFNHEALVWEAALDTYAERKALLIGQNVQVGHLVG